MTIVRCGSHEQQVPADFPEALSESIALCILGLATEIGSGHAMRLVTNDQVPFGGLRKSFLKFFVASQDIQSRYKSISIIEWIAGARCFDHVTRKDVEFESELLAEFVLPLLHQASRRDNKASFHVAARDQFFHQKASHDCLPGSWIVCQQKT